MVSFCALIPENHYCNLRVDVRNRQLMAVFAFVCLPVEFEYLLSGEAQKLRLCWRLGGSSILCVY